MSKEKARILLYSAINEVNGIPNGGIGMAIGVSKVSSLIQQALKELEDE